MTNTLRHLLPCIALLAAGALCAPVLAQSTATAGNAPDSVTYSQSNKCDHGQVQVWPTVEAYASAKGFPPAATTMESYRYLVLRILEMCNNGDTLVLGDSTGIAASAFRRLMVEFCAEEDISSTPIPGVDAGKNPNAGTFSCKVTRMDSLKGRPDGTTPSPRSMDFPRKTPQLSEPSP